MNSNSDNSDALGPMVHFTPLRYPGGKGKLAAFVKRVVVDNGLCDGEYAEPYAGGAAVALELLFHEYVSHIHLNDISRAVYCFWWSVLECTEDLCRLIGDTPCSMESWDRQKKILMNPSQHGQLEVGFATFFLNRTNRSGILNGGVIGGRDQSGPWKMDARFNAPELIRRIKAIANLRRRISISNNDALDFLKDCSGNLPKKSLVYLDPPYYEKGKDLYYNFYRHDDHVAISTAVSKWLKKQKWIVSYDNAPEICDMYDGYESIFYSIGYSARNVKQGAEVMFFSPGLRIPPLVGSMRSLAA